MRELLDLLEVVVGGDEHLAERSRVDEPHHPALRERDHDVRVLRRLVARRLRAQQLARHPEVDDQRFGSVEPQHEVLPAARDRHDLVAFERADELLLLLVAPDRAQARDLDRLDLLADDLLLEIAAHHFDLR